MQDVSRKLAQERPHFVVGLNAITPCNGMTGSKERLSEVWVLRHEEMPGYYVAK